MRAPPLPRVALNALRILISFVFALNLALAALAYATLLTQSDLAHIAAFAAGCLLVNWLLHRFAQKR